LKPDPSIWWIDVVKNPLWWILMPTKSLQPITKIGETWSYAKIENREISLFVSAKQKKKNGA
jgi:hypothetical protein